MEMYYREVPHPMTKVRLVSIAGMLKGIESASNGQITMDEVTDALTRAMNGDVMIYDGSWKGLCPAIDGNPYDENSGFNKRQEIITEFFNSKYWERQDQNFKGIDGRIDIRDYLILRDDAEAISQRLWWFFYPNRGANTDILLGTNTSPEPKKIQTMGNADSTPGSADADMAINGQTFDRLRRAISAFPTKYADYKTQPPKLDDDVRLWLKDTGLAENEAERRVFGVIIREHFQLSTDTQKN